MHSDLEHARRALDHKKNAMQTLEGRRPETPAEICRHEAELHLARLRTYLAQGRVIALEKDRLAHQACEAAPRKRH